MRMPPIPSDSSTRRRRRRQQPNRFEPAAAASNDDEERVNSNDDPLHQYRHAEAAATDDDDDDDDDDDNNNTDVDSDYVSQDRNHDDDDENDGDWWEDSDDDDQNDDDDVVALGRHTLLWLCQEGQMETARRRFERLKQMSQSEVNVNRRKQFLQQLHREVFQQARNGDKNFAIHEILMGGLDDRNAQQLAVQLLDYAAQHHPNEYRNMLLVQPPSHKRTALHWAVWSRTSIDIVRKVIVGNPEALLKKDSVGRIPLDIYRHYFVTDSDNSRRRPHQHDSNTRHRPSRRRLLASPLATAAHVSSTGDAYLELLHRTTESWTQHRVRRTIHLCALQYFSSPISSSSLSSPSSSSKAKPKKGNDSGVVVTATLTPFNEHDRKQVGVKPKAWFVLSVLGSCIQMEMKPLLKKILEYTGGNATTARAANRKRKK